MARYDFSVAFGSPTAVASEHSRPFDTDDQAKSARDAMADELKQAGFKVSKSTLRGQRREWWGWSVLCGITCTVYSVESK